MKSKVGVRRKNRSLSKDIKPTFNYKLNKQGCKNVASAVLKSAVKDKDVYFFTSGNYLIYEEISGIRYPLETWLGFNEALLLKN